MSILKTFIEKKKQKTKIKTQIFNFANTTVVYMSTPKHMTFLKLISNSMHPWKKEGGIVSALPKYKLLEDWPYNFYVCNNISMGKCRNKIRSLNNVMINKLLLSTIYSFRTYIRVRGVGYRFFVNENLLMVHVGYSHVNIICLPGSIATKLSRKYSRILLQGKPMQPLVEAPMTLRAKIRKFRSYDIFVGKGIRYRYDTYKLKEGKKKKTF